MLARMSTRKRKGLPKQTPSFAASPAAGSGLSAGDVITSVDGYGVTSQSSLQAVMVNDVRPGQTVTIQYTDTAGQSRTTSVVLTSGPPA
jgi:S1-C subfamily serine protease